MSKIYIVALRKPDPSMAIRYELEDAQSAVDDHNARFPQTPVYIWKVERDGTVVKVGQVT